MLANYTLVYCIGGTHVGEGDEGHEGHGAPRAARGQVQADHTTYDTCTVVVPQLVRCICQTTITALEWRPALVLLFSVCPPADVAK